MPTRQQKFANIVTMLKEANDDARDEDFEYWKERLFWFIWDNRNVVTLASGARWVKR